MALKDRIDDYKIDLSEKDRETLVRIAEDMQKGNDRLYELNVAEIEERNTKAREAYEITQKYEEQLVQVKQKLKFLRLDGLKLQLEIDQQIDTKASLQQKS